MASASASVLLRISEATVLRVVGTDCSTVYRGPLRLISASSMYLLQDNAGGVAFTYPLVGQPALRSEDRVFILPSQTQAEHFVVYVSPGESADVVTALAECLSDVTALRSTAQLAAARATVTSAAPPAAAAQSSLAPAPTAVITLPSPVAAAPAPPTTTAGKVGETLSTVIIAGGALASKALVAGADAAGRGFRWGASTLTSYLHPLHGTPAAPTLSPATMRHLQRAKMVSSSAVVVSAGVVAGAAATAKALGAAISAAVLSTDVGKRLSESGKTETGQAVKQVAASSLVAFATVWDGLEVAAKTFGTHAAAGIHQVVEHRYGPDAGAVARQSLSVASDVGRTALHMRNLGVGGMVRRTAAETARELLTAGDAEPPAPATTPRTLEAPAPPQLLTAS